jgi:hypothetical protein
MHKHTDPAGAAAELLKRRSIRTSLSEWARYKDFEPAPHHQLFIREIEAFLKSEDEVLLLFAPPGSAKSTYVSVLLPSWYLAANPTHSILAAERVLKDEESTAQPVNGDDFQLEYYSDGYPKLPDVLTEDASHSWLKLHDNLTSMSD